MAVILKNDSLRAPEEQPEKPRAVLVSILTDADTVEDVDESMDELARLLDTAGGTVAARMVQSRSAPDARTLIGSGKVRELADMCRNLEASLVVFDCDLTPVQIRNMEDDIGIEDLRVIDRSMLILDIFALHAVTAEGKLQVELAQLQYTAPRLTGRGTDMSRLGGGIGTRGPGESKLESDRRHMKRRVDALKAELAVVEKNRRTMRQSRDRSGLPRIAIVGYTNAGKSTLLNTLTGAGILAEDKLFATLDTTVRKVIIDNLPFLLTDTIGFIRKLPTHLVDSFKSTLDEVRDADILVHVVDISHPQFEEQIEVVNRTLQEVCESKDKPMILVFNKVDAFTYVKKDDDDLTPRLRENIPLEELKQTWMAKMNDNCIFISARERINIDELKSRLYEMAKEIHMKRFPYNDFLFQKYDEEDLMQ